MRHVKSEWLILSSVPMDLKTQSQQAMGIGTFLHDRRKALGPRGVKDFPVSPYPALASYSIAPLACF